MRQKESEEGVHLMFKRSDLMRVGTRRGGENQGFGERVNPTLSLLLPGGTWSPPHRGRSSRTGRTLAENSAVE